MRTLNLEPLGEKLEVRHVTVDEASHGQRLDNFLMRIAKGVPKSHLWRIIRSGEVRVNRKKANPSDKVFTGDDIRIPPVRVAMREAKPVPKIDDKDLVVLFEDKDIIVIDKPAHMAVHGGSGVSFGLIERLRATREAAPFLELVHRLDKETSGAIIIAKTRKALVRLHEAIREGKVFKTYLALLIGECDFDVKHVKNRLLKFVTKSGERRVRIDSEGQESHSIFKVIERFEGATFVEVNLKTGRTHQIRVHAASLGHPIVGDDKYGNFEMNDALATGAWGSKFNRMFLHAHRIEFLHPITGEKLSITAPLPLQCQNLLRAMKDSIDGSKV